MRDDFLKTLWLLRFDKIKKMEEEAAWGYQEVLDRCLSLFGKNDDVIKHLEKLVQEERQHAKLGDELIQICRQNHTEWGLL